MIMFELIVPSFELIIIIEVVDQGHHQVQTSLGWLVYVPTYIVKQNPFFYY